ncbi:MAG: asparagine synthase-related protein [Elusimicrobiota bacterium]
MVDNKPLDNKLLERLKSALTDSAKRNAGEGSLFSGGLDTGILSSLSPKTVAINVSLENYAPDLKFAKILEKYLCLKIHYLTIKIDEAISVIPQVIKILKSFDPAIPNDIPVYFGLKFAKKLGLKSIVTGDGSDELLAGYTYMQNINNLDDYIRRIARNMYFSSNELGKFFGIKIKQPYMDKQFIDFVLTIDTKFKIKREQNKIFGKWILRKAFENDLPDNAIWQSKRPLEVGSGMTKLRKILTDKISDTEFVEKQKIYPIKFINKEHLYYYEIYKNVVGKIPKPKKNEKSCNGCGAGMKIQSFHCKVCGYVLISDKS